MRRLALAAAVVGMATTPALADMYQDGSNVKLPEALTNFGYGSVLAASVTCTTASGSQAITGCTSTAGLKPGMAIRGPGIPAGATVAGGITATGFTLSAAATANGSGLVTIRHLPFWTDDGGEPSIWRFPGRIMVGNAIGQPSARFDPFLTFCPDAPHCANWAARDSDVAVMSSRGAMALTGISRTSDGGAADASPPPTIGVSGFVIGDASRPPGGSAGWASYLDVQLNPEADGSNMLGMEIALKNRGGNYTTTSYEYNLPGVFGIKLSPGGAPDYGGANLNPANAGILIGPPITGDASYRFNTGILFNNLSLSGTDGITGCCGVAIEMAKNQVIKWQAPDNTDGFIIHSEVNTSSAGVQMVALDNTISFLGPGGGNRIFEIVNAPGAVNTVQTFDGVTGSPGGLRIISSVDPSVDLVLQPQGNGTVNPAVGLKLPNYTVATLPVCWAGFTYVMAAVSDATAPGYNAALTGGGAVKVPVMCDGAAWKAH